MSSDSDWEDGNSKTNNKRRLSGRAATNSKKSVRHSDSPVSSRGSSSSYCLTPVLRPRRNVVPVREEAMETDSGTDNELVEAVDSTVIERTVNRSEHSDDQPDNGTPEPSMFEVLQRKDASVEEICDSWMEKYRLGSTESLVQLLQFIIHSTGCKGVLTPEIMRKTVNDLLMDFVKDFSDEEAGYYPLIRTGKSALIFRHNFSEFFYQWTKRLGRKMFSDDHEDFMEGFNMVVLGMTDHQLRNYRHTATVAVIKIMSALINERLSVFMKMHDKQRQLDAEQNKRLNERSEDRINVLRASQMSLEEDFENYKTLLEFYHKCVFNKRFRDTCTEIRILCISALGSWMKQFPQEYVRDSYLKFFDVTLTDPSAQVRCACLEYLLPLYMDGELSDKLRQFTSKCKNRLMGMTVNANADVSEKAIRLITAISKTYSVLTTRDVEIIYQMVYAADGRCGAAAAEFLSERLFVIHSGASIDSPKKTAAGKNRRPNTPLIKDLVDFVIESDLPNHAEYLVDAMIDIQPLMKDWATMTELLLEDPGPEEQALTELQESTLINLMTCSVKQAATGIHPLGRVPRSKVMASGKLSVTNHFMTALPKLLSKYQRNDKIIATLLSIPLYFDLKLYATTRQQNSLESLLDILKATVENHSSSEVTDVAAKALETLCLNERLTSSKTEGSLLQVLEAVSTSLLSSNRSYEESIANGLNSKVEVDTLCTDIQKVAHFCRSFDLSSLAVWETGFEILRLTCSRRREYPMGVVKDAVSICYFTLVWSMKSIKEQEEEGDVEQEAILSKVHDLKKLTKRLLVALRLFLSNESPCQELKEPAFTAICDTLLLFSKKDGDEFWKVNFAMTVDQSFVKLLTRFLIDTVFEADSIADGESTAAKNRTNVILFCKLLIFNIIEPKYTADVFRYYLKYFSEFGDIFKIALDHIRKTDHTMFANLLISTLIKLYEDSASPDGILHLYNLAKRFSLLFGIDASKYQPALIALHREGIHFAVHSFEAERLTPPVNLSFLKVLIEFSGKLTGSSKKIIYQYLNQSIDVDANDNHSSSSDFAALWDYKQSLGFGANESTKRRRKSGNTPAARTRLAKSKSRRTVTSTYSS